MAARNRKARWPQQLTRMVHEYREALCTLGVEINEAVARDKIRADFEDLWTHYFAQQVGTAMGLEVVPLPGDRDSDDDTSDA